MAGLLNPQIDGLGLGLLGASQALLTPRRQGGGVGAAFGAFGQGLAQGQQMEAQQRAALLREQMAQQQMAMNRDQMDMSREKFGFEKQQYEAEQAQKRAVQERTAQVRATLAMERPDLLPMFDMNPGEAMKRMFPEVQDKVVPAGGAVVRDGKAVFQNPKEPTQSDIGRLIGEMNSLPAGDPRRALYAQALQKATTHAPAASMSVTNVQEKEESKTVGAAMGKTFVEIQNAGMQARGKINNLSRLESLLQGYETGKLTPIGKEIAGYAASVGINLDKNLGNKEAAEALSNELALQARNPSGGAGMPGAMSDADREFLRNMVPNLAKSTQGNRTIVETQRRLAKREIDVARMAGEYRAKTGTLDPQFFQQLQAWSDSNPLFSDMASVPVIAPDGKSATGVIGKPGAAGWALERIKK